MIRVFHPGSGSWIWILDLDPDFLPIPNPVVKKAPDPGSAALKKLSEQKRAYPTVDRMRKPDWFFLTPMKKPIFHE
jgi:hypothetical protein